MLGRKKDNITEVVQESRGGMLARTYSNRKVKKIQASTGYTRNF